MVAAGATNAHLLLWALLEMRIVAALYGLPIRSAQLLWPVGCARAVARFLRLLAVLRGLSISGKTGRHASDKLVSE